MKAVRPLLQFNCNNLKTLTGLQAGTVRELRGISDKGKEV
jgi:hypothetical protein